MNRINVKKIGLAAGATGALLYAGCALVMMLAGREGTIRFFNTLLHGLDVSSIVRMEMSPLKAGIGLVQTFVLWWLIAACIAAIYNLTTPAAQDRPF